MTNTTKALSIPNQVRTLIEDKKAEIAATLPSYLDNERFIRIALLAVTKNKDIQQCTPESIFLAIMESARIGLQPDNKEAAIIKYGNSAELMPMVGGIKNLILRSPGVLKVESRAVYEDDEFGYEYGLHPNLIHRPKGGDTKDRQLTHAYAIAWRQGTDPTFEVMDADQIAQVRASSRAPNSPAWKLWYGEMARKAVLKRLSKYLDLSPEASRAIELDHAVVGDPTMIGSLDGPSEAYQNLLVKNQTKARLEELKEELNVENGDTEPPTEDEEKKEPEPETEKVANPTGKAYPGYMVDGLIKAELADNPYNATAVLNQFPDLARNTKKDEVVRLVTIYRKRRGEELSPPEAASVAWEEWKGSI